MDEDISRMIRLLPNEGLIGLIIKLQVLRKFGRQEQEGAESLFSEDIDFASEELLKRLSASFSGEARRSNKELVDWLNEIASSCNFLVIKGGAKLPRFSEDLTPCVQSIIKRLNFDRVFSKN